MSIRLTTGSRIAETSSKGNQEKWLADGRWYKLDLFGYEGLAETVTSALLAQTNTDALGFRYVTYRMERMQVHGHIRNGCSSANFLRQGEAILTLAELLRKGVGPDWQTAVNRLPNLQSRLAWLVEQVERLTGLDRFGTYLTLLFEVDMLFGNEDRHLNNIAVLRCGDGFDYCPIFDFGAGLLSNTRDYPMEIEPPHCASAQGSAHENGLCPTGPCGPKSIRAAASLRLCRKRDHGGPFRAAGVLRRAGCSLYP